METTFTCKVLNGYRIIQKLGEGTYGEAFLVENMKTNQRFTLKKQKKMEEADCQGGADADAEREIEFLEQNTHPFIVKQIESFPLEEDPTLKCLVLEHADGRDLGKVLKANGKAFTE